jgi:hypothetical protein
MGPHGTLLAILGLPFTVYLLYILCDAEGCPSSQLFQSWPNAKFYLMSSVQEAQFWSWEAFGAILSWFVFQMLLYVIIPGEWALGILLRTGDRLRYKINAFRIFILTLGLLVGVVKLHGLAPLLWIADHYLELASAAIVLSTTLSLYLYLYSFRSDKVLLAEGGNSGYPIYDFWMGRELNPRWTNKIDLKYFCELRPGLIGWTILNIALAAKQFSVIGKVTNSMILVVLFEGYYVVDALWNEKAILTTMDITTDGFGYMLAFGDLVWVPFTYSLQGKYLNIAFLSAKA